MSSIVMATDFIRWFDQVRMTDVSDEDVLQLAKWACVIEDHYSQLRGQESPMDMDTRKRRSALYESCEQQ